MRGADRHSSPTAPVPSARRVLKHRRVLHHSLSKSFTAFRVVRAAVVRITLKCVERRVWHESCLHFGVLLLALVSSVVDQPDEKKKR